MIFYFFYFHYFFSILFVFSLNSWKEYIHVNCFSVCVSLDILNQEQFYQMHITLTIVTSFSIKLFFLPVFVRERDFSYSFSTDGKDYRFFFLPSSFSFSYLIYNNLTNIDKNRTRILDEVINKYKHFRCFLWRKRKV